MKARLALLTILLAAMPATIALAGPPEVGVRQITAPSRERGVELDVTVWYPALPKGTPEAIGESAIFTGTPALRDAPIADGRFPLILLSHGAGLAGSAQALSWIATPLARRGFLVAAPTHPGSTGANRSAAETMKLWLRPSDIADALGAVEKDAVLGEHLEAGSAGVLGLSMGGGTALALAGARMVPERLAGYCDSDALNPSLCGWVRQSGVDLHSMDLAPAGRDYIDPRIRFVMAIDPAPVEVFDIGSLPGITTPVELVNLGAPGQIPSTLDASRIAASIPGARYALVEGASHFSMFATCKPGAPAVLEAEDIGDPICSDGGGRSREAIHAQLIDAAATAFSRALKAPSAAALASSAPANSEPAVERGIAVEKIGVSELRIDDRISGRSLFGAAWYPTASIGTATLMEDGPVWRGFEAVRAAAPEAGPFPLVILSHGWTGNWRNEAWLAVALARRGALVAAIDHPGTTSFDRASAETPKLWERVRDVGRVIDGLAADPRFAGRIDMGRIAVIGHSMGGWTAVAAAGGRVDTMRAGEDCAAHPQLASCRWLAEHADGTATAKILYEQDLREPRVRAAVSLDLGLTGSFSPASLAAVEVPVLVLAAGGENAELPAELESRRLAGRLPAATTTYVEYPDASHFSFVRECRPDGIEVLKRVDPGEEYVCRDGILTVGASAGSRNRAELHAAMLGDIEAFLAKVGILDGANESAGDAAD